MHLRRCPHTGAPAGDNPGQQSLSPPWLQAAQGHTPTLLLYWPPSSSLAFKDSQRREGFPPLACAERFLVSLPVHNATNISHVRVAPIRLDASLCVFIHNVQYMLKESQKARLNFQLFHLIQTSRMNMFCISLINMRADFDQP